MTSIKKTFFASFVLVVGMFLAVTPTAEAQQNNALIQAKLNIVSSLITIAEEHPSYADMIIPAVTATLNSLAANLANLSSLVQFVQENPEYAETILPTVGETLDNLAEIGVISSESSITANALIAIAIENPDNSADIYTGLSASFNSLSAATPVSSHNNAASLSASSGTQQPSVPGLPPTKPYVPSSTIASYFPVLMELGLKPPAPVTVSAPSTPSVAVLKCVTKECLVSTQSNNQASLSAAAYVPPAPVTGGMPSDIVVDVDIHQDLGYTIVRFDQAGIVTTYQISTTNVAQIIDSLALVQPNYTKFQLVSNINTIQYAD